MNRLAVEGIKIYAAVGKPERGDKFLYYLGLGMRYADALAYTGGTQRFSG